MPTGNIVGLPIASGTLVYDFEAIADWRSPTPFSTPVVLPASDNVGLACTLALEVHGQLPWVIAFGTASAPPTVPPATISAADAKPCILIPPGASSAIPGRSRELRLVTPGMRFVARPVNNIWGSRVDT